MLDTTGKKLYDIVREGRWRQVLGQNVQDNAALVDVSSKPRADNGTKVKMHAMKSIPANNDVVLFFPNTSSSNNLAIVETRKFTAYANLEQTLDAALKSTKISNVADYSLETLPFAIHHDGYFYRFWDACVQHTYYIIWMTWYTEYNDSGYRGQPLNNVPVVFEMDGRRNPISVTPLCYKGEEEGHWAPLPARDCITRIHIPNVELFTKEVIERTTPSPGFNLKTVDDEQGQDTIRNVRVSGTESLEIVPSVDLEMENFE